MRARSRSLLLKMWTGVDIGGVESVPVVVDWITAPFGSWTVRPPPVLTLNRRLESRSGKKVLVAPLS